MYLWNNDFSPNKFLVVRGGTVKLVDYQVQSPNELYLGRTHSSWVTDWFNWFLSADADTRTLGPVVFVRSVGIQKSNDLGESGTGTDLNDLSVSNAHADDPTYARKYVNKPNVRVGGDRLQIYSDQAVLVPIIVAYSEASRPHIDWGWMQDYTGLTIDYGDNPPERNQLTIDGKDIQLPGELGMNAFRIVTPVFTAVVPETDYGRSVKDFLEMALPPGHYPVMVDGYFVLIRFHEPKNYLLRSFAAAPRERRGPYFSELIYQIEVNQRPTRRGILPNSPAPGFNGPSRGAPGFANRIARNDTEIAKVLYEKMKSGELDPKLGSQFGLWLGLDVVGNIQTFSGSLGKGTSSGSSGSSGSSRSSRSRRRKP